MRPNMWSIKCQVFFFSQFFGGFNLFVKNIVEGNWHDNKFLELQTSQFFGGFNLFVKNIVETQLA